MALVTPIEGCEVLTPINGMGTDEITVGLLGAKIDPVRGALGVDGKYLTEVRMLEAERRILAIEAAIEKLQEIIQP